MQVDLCLFQCEQVETLSGVECCLPVNLLCVQLSLEGPDRTDAGGSGHRTRQLCLSISPHPHLLWQRHDMTIYHKISSCLVLACSLLYFTLVPAYAMLY